MNNKTPNEVFKYNDDQIARHLLVTDKVHNQKINKSVPFDDGDKVSILEKKEKFGK